MPPRFTKIALIIFFILLIVYAYYEARAALYGPQIDIPSEIIVVTQSFMEIQGQATYISELKLNGAVIPVTEDGHFSEKLLLVPGENRLIFDAKDRFGRETQEVAKVYYKPTNDISPPKSAATSTETRAPSESEEITD
jgi:hypothetical protein